MCSIAEEWRFKPNHIPLRSKQMACQHIYSSLYEQIYNEAVVARCFIAGQDEGGQTAAVGNDSRNQLRRVMVVAFGNSNVQIRKRSNDGYRREPSEARPTAATRK